MTQGMIFHLSFDNNTCFSVKPHFFKFACLGINFLCQLYFHQKREARKLLFLSQSNPYYLRRISAFFHYNRSATLEVNDEF